MDYTAMCAVMRELLPRVSAEALSAWEAFVVDMCCGSASAEAQMRGELCAEMLIVREQYGSELAVRLFNMGERYVVNTFELPGAAELLSNGASEAETFEEITHCGWHPSRAHQSSVRLVMQALV